jgi:hypothetical protein
VRIVNQKLNDKTSLTVKTWAIVILLSIIVVVISGIMDFLRGMGTLFGGTGNSPGWVDSIWHILKSPTNAIFFVVSLAALISILKLSFKYKKFDKYILFNLLILLIFLALYLFA